MKRQGADRRGRNQRGKRKDKNTNTVDYVTDTRCLEGKHGYRSKEDAKRAMRLARGKGHLTLKRAYRCVSCGLWHLTSMSITEYEERIGR